MDGGQAIQQGVETKFTNRMAGYLHHSRLTTRKRRNRELTRRQIVLHTNNAVVSSPALHAPLLGSDVALRDGRLKFLLFRASGDTPASIAEAGTDITRVR
jgi:hypothetical protein